ncbi:hypothetical protein [Thermus sp.]|uniref:hypothetical protein n=1 Tax=Thermus sp. TaxID=275 RepID=UPI003D10EEF8
MRQLDTGPLEGAYYRTGGGSWQALSFSGGQATFTASGDYEVAVRCRTGTSPVVDLHLFKGTVSQANTLTFACTVAGGSYSTRTFQVTLPQNIGNQTIQAGDNVFAGPGTAGSYEGTNPVTVEQALPDGQQEVLFTVFRLSGSSSATPIGYKLVSLNVQGSGPFTVDATGWQPFTATRSVNVNAPQGLTSVHLVFFFKDGMKSAGLIGFLGPYGTLSLSSGKYLGLAGAFRSSGTDNVVAYKDTGGADWNVSLLNPWSSGQFSVNRDRFTFSYPGVQGYGLKASGLVKSTQGAPLTVRITVYASGSGSTTYTVPVVNDLGYALEDFTTRQVSIESLEAFKGNLAQSQSLETRNPSESALSGLDFSLAQRQYLSFTGPSYTLP